MTKPGVYWQLSGRLGSESATVRWQDGEWSATDDFLLLNFLDMMGAEVVGRIMYVSPTLMEFVDAGRCAEHLLAAPLEWESNLAEQWVDGRVY